MKRKATVAAAGVALIGGFEGLRQVAYPDPATKGPPWTVCYGRAYGVNPGDRHSLDECKAMLVQDLDKYARGVEACITRPLPDTTYIAFVSLAYNIGTGGFCKSSVVRLYNAGDHRGSCDAMLRFNKAAGVTFPGLTKRRERERQWCIKGADL
jgi:lysozyme